MKNIWKFQTHYAHNLHMLVLGVLSVLYVVGLRWVWSCL